MAALSELLNTRHSTPARHTRNNLAQRVSRYHLPLAIGNVAALLAIVVLVIQLSGTDLPERQPTEMASGEPTIVINTAGSVAEGIAFSPDGKIVATGGGNDHTARLWDSTTGRLIRPLIGTGVAQVIAFSPNGRSVISNDLAMWNPATGENMREIKGGGWSAAFSMDGSILAAGDLENTVRLWAPDTGKLIRTMAFTKDPQNIREPAPRSAPSPILTGRTGWRSVRTARFSPPVASDRSDHGIRRPEHRSAH